MENEGNNVLQIATHESVESTELVTGNVQILQSLNVNLQIKCHNLENEVTRLKKEVETYKGKNFIYESLSNELASLRTQFDKTSIALVRKCNAYDSLKKEFLAYKAEHKISPTRAVTPIRPNKPISPLPTPTTSRNTNMKKLEIFEDAQTLDDKCLRRPTGRPSMGSCGNITKEIDAEEVMPSRFKTNEAPLRNRVLIRCLSLKSASTESLESVGRKSLKAKETEETKEKEKKPAKTTQQSSRIGRSNLNSSFQNKMNTSAQGKVNLNSSGTTKTKTPAATSRVPPSSRAALGYQNGPQRMVKMNAASVKRSNSNCSTSSTKSVSSRPVFRA